LRIGGIKTFADGALGPRTAAMIQPYTGEPNNTGILLLDAEELYEVGIQAVENGLSLAVHAIGDRANHEVLNAIRELRKQESKIGAWHTSPLRHRVEHVQVIHPDDAGRYAALGVIASMQPVHIVSDMETADRYWGDRAAFSYGWRMQLDHGATLAFGSDAPVESPNPFWGLHAAITRRQPDGRPSGDGWYPEQNITLLEALKAYTSGAAYATYMEDWLGILAPGYLADLLVLDNDPFTCSPDELREIQPLATMVGGEWVFNEL
jgi:predicted amidohydrolase YtcJ